MKVVAIEGLDGAGKTSLCRALSQSDWDGLRVAVVASPSEKVSDLCFSWRGRKPEGSALAFMLGTKMMFNEYIRQHDVVLLDRYLLSTIVHHYDVIAGRELEFSYFLNAMDYVPADATVFLSVDVVECQRRISMRAMDRPLIVELAEQLTRYDAVRKENHFRYWLGQNWVDLSNGAEANFQDIILSVKSLVHGILD